MVTDQTNITQAIAHVAIEAVKAAVQAVVVALSKDSSGARNELTSTGPNWGRPTLRQPTFDRSSTEKYEQLRNCRLEVDTILQSYSVNNTEK